MLVSLASFRMNGHQDEVMDTYRGAFLALKMSEIYARPCALQIFGTKNRDNTIALVFSYHSSNPPYASL